MHRFLPLLPASWTRCTAQQYTSGAYRYWHTIGLVFVTSAIFIVSTVFAWLCVLFSGSALHRTRNQHCAPLSVMGEDAGRWANFSAPSVIMVRVRYKRWTDEVRAESQNTLWELILAFTSFIPFVGQLIYNHSVCSGSLYSNMI